MVAFILFLCSGHIHSALIKEVCPEQTLQETRIELSNSRKYSSYDRIKELQHQKETIQDLYGHHVALHNEINTLRAQLRIAIKRME